MGYIHPIMMQCNMISMIFFFCQANLTCSECMLDYGRALLSLVLFIIFKKIISSLDKL